MSHLSNFIRRALRLPGVPEARHVTERAVAPYLRADLTSLHETILDHNHRLLLTETTARDINLHMPALLNSIASTNGVTRLLRREAANQELAVLNLDARLNDVDARLNDVDAQLEDVDARLNDVDARLNDVDARFKDVDVRLNEVDAQLTDAQTRIKNTAWLPDGLQAVRSDFEPHIDTLKWLTTRIETVRAEMLHELRYGRAAAPDPSPVEVKIVREGALDADRGPIRLNLGCGHIPVTGYVNVDMRELPGVDVVAPVDGVPVESMTVEEIFSAHVLEHFPEMELSRKLLPLWFSLLRPGGLFRAIVPDLASMIHQYQRGDIDFEALRLVAYGGQEYEGDFHFTAFTPESLGLLLTDAGFEDVDAVAIGRPNGDCLEFEITARRPG